MHLSAAGLVGTQTRATTVALSALSLPELRTYRQHLLAEEDRVSYWRRLVHARLDLHRAGEAHDGPLGVEQIVAALRATGAGTRRRAFTPIASTTPLPPLPELERFWQRTDSPGELDSSLSEVEEELSAYRRAVHTRLDEVTAELVLRYRRAPGEALALLPEVEQ